MRTTTAAIVLRGDLLLLAHRKSGGAIGGKWEFPGGKVRYGENPREALVRELSEELATDAEVGSELGGIEFTNDATEYRLRAFEVTVTAIGETPMHDEVRWIHRSELDRYDLAESDRRLARALGLLPADTRRE